MLRFLSMSLLISFMTCAGFMGFLKIPNSFSDEDEYKIQRENMVEHQIITRGIKNPSVLSAMLKVKRHLFVPKGMMPFAYNDNALPIDNRQTISQPYIVALMTELAHLKPTDKVLEIGTGSGYQAAILAECVKKVYSIELIKELADQADQRLISLGYKNIEIKNDDGYMGWPEHAPFDAIIVTAAAPEVPQELVKQLKAGGRMIIPLGEFFQDLFVITKNPDGTIKKESNIGVRFVPMVKGGNKIP